jgi:hypothetical protein
MAMLSTQAFATQTIDDNLTVTGNVEVGVSSGKDTYIEVGNSSDKSSDTGFLKINGYDNTIRFNDTFDADDKPYEWSIFTENWSDSTRWAVYNVYANGNIILLDIGENTAANAVDSLVVDNTGDIFLANGTVSIDKSLLRMGIGTSIPEDNLHIVDNGSSANAGVCRYST